MSIFVSHHYHYGDRDLAVRVAKLEAIVSQLTDALSGLKSQVSSLATSSADAISRSQSDHGNLVASLAGLQSQVTTLQAQVDAGGATPADLQTIADIKAQITATQAALDALDPTNPSTLSQVPPATPPAPAATPATPPTSPAAPVDATPATPTPSAPTAPASPPTGP